MQKIIAHVDSLKHQKNFVHSQAKFPALIGGFGSGKTEALVQRAMKLKYDNPIADIACYEPTYDLIRTILYPKFEYFLNHYGIQYYLHEHNKELYIANYGKIVFRSMDNPEMIIGYEVADSIIDELDVLKKEKAELAWRKIIARNRQKKIGGVPNTVSVTTTPEGYKFVYDKWHDSKNNNYQIIRAKTSDNPFLPDDYVETLKSDYDERLLEAYLNGNFVNLQQGQVYYSFDREYLSTKLRIDPALTVNLCVDFNVDPMCWEICQHRNKADIRVVHEIVKRNTNTWEMCHEFKRIVPKNCTVIVYGDASGSARDTRSGYSDYAIIFEELSGQYNLTFKVPNANPPIKDRINAVNSRLSKGSILINKENKFLVEDLEQVVWKKDEIDKSGKDRTHASDGFGYYIATEFPIIKKPSYTIQNK